MCSKEFPNVYREIVRSIQFTTTKSTFKYFSYLQVYSDSLISVYILYKKDNCLMQPHIQHHKTMLDLHKSRSMAGPNMNYEHEVLSWYGCSYETMEVYECLPKYIIPQALTVLFQGETLISLKAFLLVIANTVLDLRFKCVANPMGVSRPLCSQNAPSFLYNSYPHESFSPVIPSCFKYHVALYLSYHGDSLAMLCQIWSKSCENHSK